MNLLDTLGHFWVSTTSAIIGASLILIPTTIQPATTATSNPNQQPNQAINSFKTTGTYEYLGQKIQYIVYIPKQGGEIFGEISGLCNGEVTGEYKPGKVPEVEGMLSVKCKMVFISQNASAKFTGKIDQGEKKAYLDWVGDGFIAGKRGSVILNLLSVR